MSTSWRGSLNFVVVKWRMSRILMKCPVLEVERLRPLLGKFWHKIPDSNSPGTRSLDGNGRRKRTFVALYGRIGYQMHRTRVDRRKTKGAECAALSRLSHAEVRSLSDATRSHEIMPCVSHNDRSRYNFGKSNFFDIKSEKYLHIYTYIHLIICIYCL